jgi:hypothetical protein
MHVTLFTSPDHVDEDIHMDISPRAEIVAPKQVDAKYPYAHYSLEEWSARRESSTGARSTYGGIIKNDLVELVGKSIQVVTLKQVREQDRRHLERLEREYAWQKKLEALISVAHNK